MPLDDRQISRLLEAWRPILLDAQKEGMALSFSVSVQPDGNLYFSISATTPEPESPVQYGTYWTGASGEASVKTHE